MPQFSLSTATGTSPPLTPIVTNQSDRPSTTDGTITVPTGPIPTDGSDTPPLSSPSTPPNSKQVQFPTDPSPVTSYSRPLSDSELWPLYLFEQHARACRECLEPYEVNKRGKALCRAGRHLGRDVADVVYSQRDGQDILAISDVFNMGKDAASLTHVELPYQYVQVRSLLRAVERTWKCRRRAEKKTIVNREDESKQRELSKARKPSPERSPRRHRRLSDVEEESNSPRRDEDSPARHRHESPARAEHSSSASARRVSRSYHESELPSRHRASPTPSTASRTESHRPPLQVKQQRPAPVPVQSPNRALDPVPQEKAATFPPTQPNGTISLPYRRQSAGTPPSSFKYQAPLASSSRTPVTSSPLVRSSSVSSASNASARGSWAGPQGVATSKAHTSADLRRPSQVQARGEQR